MAKPNAELAARIRDEITARPEFHDPASRIGNIMLAPYDQDLGRVLGQGDTLNVAAYAVYFAGGTLHNGRAEAWWLGYTPHTPDSVAAGELTLSDTDATWLFSHERTHEEVVAALRQLADGATRIDTDAITDPDEAWPARIDESRLRDTSDNSPAPRHGTWPDPYDEPYGFGPYPGPHGAVHAAADLSVCICG